MSLDAQKMLDNSTRFYKTLDNGKGLWYTGDMDKSLVVAYTRISPGLKSRLLDLGKKHGHAQTREGKAKLSTVIRWGLTEWVEIMEEKERLASE